MDFEKYKELNEKISADKSLNERAMKKITEEKMKPKKIFSNFSKIAAILIAVALLSATAYAAVKGFGISDVFKVKNIEGAKKLSTTSEETYKGKYGSYKMKEYVFDGNTFYICIEAKALNDDVLLLTDYFEKNAETFWGRNRGSIKDYGVAEAPAGTTFEDYAKEHNKKIIVPNITFKVVNGSEVKKVNGYYRDYVYVDDKTAYLYYNFFDHLFENENSKLRCYIDEEDWNSLDLEKEIIDNPIIENKLEFDIDITNKSNVETKTYTKFDERVNKDTGVTVNSLKVTQTEIGTYFEFNYTPNEKMKKNKGYLSFEILDEKGTDMVNTSSLFYYDDDYDDVFNNDGTCTYKVGIDKIESLDGVQFYCWTEAKKPEYGPYPLPTE